MRCKFNDRDLSQRLDATVCRYRGHPYYVRYTDRNRLSLYSLASHGKTLIHNIHPDDEYFDISTVPMGYLQINPDAVAYCTRRTARMWKQGLSADSINYQYNDRNNKILQAPSILTPAFENMVLGIYTPLNEALALLRKSDKEKEIAISRDVALKINPGLGLIFVYFKTEEIGWIPPDTSIVIVPTNDLAWVISKYLTGFTWEIK